MKTIDKTKIQEAPDGQLYQCLKCKEISKTAYCITHVQMDSNNDVTMDNWDDECVYCGGRSMRLITILEEGRR